MTRWAKPEHSKQRVNRAGRSLVAERGDWTDWNSYFDDLEVINNWRAAHAFPLNTFQTTLRRKGKKHDSTILVAQRVKRLPSIQAKLGRFPTMTLSQMQDIGGCRAILQDISQVILLSVDYERSGIKHHVHTIDDYITMPKDTGYRGIHYIFIYHSDRSKIYNGLKIEMQLRSQIQHAWATAVEIVGTFTRQALKSSQGEQDWLRFFALMGSALAAMEGSPPVPGTPIDEEELLFELRQLATRLDAVRRLKSYGHAPTVLEQAARKGDKFFLLGLDTSRNTLQVRAFKRNELAQASIEYLKIEQDFDGGHGDAVLVSVDTVANLRRAYPNYFLDTKMFVDLLELALEGAF